MMRRNKFFSLVIATAMSLTAFSGITTTALAEGEPALSDWTLTASYVEGFDTYDIYVTELDNENWTFSRTGGASATLVSRDDAMRFTWDRWAQYNQSSDGVFYYKYKIVMDNATAGSQLVKLVGASEYIIVTSTGSSDVVEYTTVVDSESDMVYTYTSDGTLVSAVSVADDAITGIKFQNTVNTNSSNSFWIYDFEYGTEDNGEAPTDAPATEEPTSAPEGPALSEWTLAEASYVEGFDYDSSIEAAAMRADLLTKGWTTTDRDDALAKRDSAVSFDWNRFAQYTGSDDGVFYYTYKIQMYNSTEGAQLVKLAGTNEYTVLSSPTASGSTYVFTTVVDTENSKAYTYKVSDGSLVSAVDITGDTITGIKFENTVNTNSNNGFWIYDFEYGVEDNGDEPTDDPETDEPTEAPTEDPTPAPFYPALSEWKLEESYVEGFDYDSSIEAAAMRADLLTKGWTTTDRDDALTKRDSAVSFDWNRFAQYTGSVDGVFYYTYKIHMYNSEEGAQLVKLVGTNEYTVLSSPTASGSTYVFTTVVDTVNAKAYTYKISDGSVVSAVDITGDTITGIKFQNTVNTNSSNSFWIYDFEFGTEVTDDPIVKTTYSVETNFDAASTEVKVEFPENINDNAVMYVAFYDGTGALVGAIIEDNIEAEKTYTTADGAVSAKVFIWDSTMIPLT